MPSPAPLHPVRFTHSTVARTGLADGKHLPPPAASDNAPSLHVRVGTGMAREAALTQPDARAAGPRRPPVLNRLLSHFPSRDSLSFSLGGALRVAGAAAAGVVGAGLGLAVGAAGVGVAVALWPLAKIGQLVNRYISEPLSERRFHNVHRAQWDALAQPMKGSIVHNGRAMDLLEQHAGIQNAAPPEPPLAQASDDEELGALQRVNREIANRLDDLGDSMRNAFDTGGRVGRQELIHLVATGERLVKALDKNDCDAHGCVRVPIGDATHRVASSAYTARAISWYLMAVAAREQAKSPDLLPGVVEEGAYILKDPGRRLYHFLNACPTARPRPSTHFNERAGHDETYVAGGILATGKPAQRGIEDFRSRMPGQGGTLLFDTLRPSNGDGVPELFIKWEKEGTQAYGAHEPHHNLADRGTRWLAAHHRYMAHAMDFIRTRPRALTDAVGARLGRPPALVRKEHVNQGPLKPTVHQALMQVAAAARAAGMTGLAARQVSSAMSRTGLQGVETTLTDLRQFAGTLPAEHAFRGRLDAFENLLDAQIRSMESVDGMKRRGAEVQLPVFAYDANPDADADAEVPLPAFDEDLKAGDFVVPDDAQPATPDLTTEDFLIS